MRDRLRTASHYGEELERTRRLGVTVAFCLIVGLLILSWYEAHQNNAKQEECTEAVQGYHTAMEQIMRYALLDQGEMHAMQDQLNELRSHVLGPPPTTEE
jgi:hypothetical protein